MKLSEIVKQYRTEHGMSQRQFSDVCHMSTGYISMLEEGNNPRTKEPLVPSIVTMRKLAAAMGMKFDELVSALDGDMIVSLSSSENAPDANDDERTSEYNDLFELYKLLKPEEKEIIRNAIKGILAGR